MPDRTKTNQRRNPRRLPRAGVAGAGALIAGVLVAAVSGLASASTPRPTVRVAHNAKLQENILVDSRGRTLYELSNETSHHLVCKTSQCLSFWPPLKVRSASTKLVKPSGVKGKLGILHRGGFFQVTLAGRPLYHFAGDKANGQDNGQGIMLAGGTWHVMAEGASSTAGGTTMGTPTTTTTTTTSSTISYPAY